MSLHHSYVVGSSPPSHSDSGSPLEDGVPLTDPMVDPEEVPYDADEIAEDCRWHELQQGTPFKNVGLNQPGTTGGLDTTPSKETPPKLRANGEEDSAWPWNRTVVDTWSTVVNTTPQRTDTMGSTTSNESTQGGLTSYLHHSASAWSTDQEDADTEQEEADPTHYQNSGNSYGGPPFGMARLSLSEESDYPSHQQQQAQQHHQRAHPAGSHQSHGHIQYAQHQQQQLSQQPQHPHSTYIQHSPTITYATAPQHSPPQQPMHLPPQQQPGMYGGYPQQPQQQQLQQQSMPPQPYGLHRQPSPPPLMYPANNMRLGAPAPPAHWGHGGLSGSASAHMTIPAPVLRSGTSGFQTSTTGPVRGMPTNQVNYSQQQTQQQQQSVGHYSNRGPGTGGVHSQPLTPVGSFVGSSGQTVQHQAFQQQQSHSHPASPRGAQSLGAGLDPHQGQNLGSNLSSYGTTPMNLSPLSSPIMSPHPSPSRFAKNHGHVQGQGQQQQQGHMTQPPSQQQQQQQQVQSGPQQPGGMHIRSSSSGISSLSSSGASTPTSQVGPGPFIAQAQQAVFQYQQQAMQQQQQQAMAQQQQQQQGHQHQRRPMPIQTQLHGHPHQQQQQYQQQQGMMQQYVTPFPHSHQGGQMHQGSSGNYLTAPGQGHAGSGSLLIKTSLLPSSSPHPSGSSSTPVSQAPALQGDSPNSKARFKAFYRDLWALAREVENPGGQGGGPPAQGGAEKAYEFGLQAMKNPEHERIQWKIAMELADLAKRQNHIPRARRWYERAHTLEPLASQVWIEHSKMEEECGELLECERLMLCGLKYCEGNEALMIKALKHHERMGDLAAARSILAKLKDAPLDRVWRTILEGGLLEARMGQMHTARRVFKYLCAHVNWYGPIYWECARVEERWGHFDLALTVVEKGLNQVPRYGPLWFMAFRLIERTCGEDMEQPRLHAHRALAHVSAELVWKMHFELAQMEERLGEFDRARESYANSINACPSNLRWKIWLSGARMELLSGDPQRYPVVRALLSRAGEEVPKKMRCMVSLELSRMYEFLGNIAEARQVLKQAQKDSKGEWKVFLESVLLELRAGNIDKAILEAESALEIHNGTGRLWAILIQMRSKQKHRLGHRLGHTNGSMKDQWAIFKLAIKEVPKSGEVWCEGARLVLNPYAPKYFNLKAAKRFLNFAIAFTPQYGDSFIEYLRLKMILEGIEEHPPLPSGASGPAQVSTPLYTAAIATANAAAAAASSSSSTGEDGSNSIKPPLTFHGSGRATPVDGNSQPISHFQRVAQLCVNAEPNYGSSWFACKSHPLWAPVEVLDVARTMIERHLVQNQHAYQTAILRYWYAPDSRQVSPLMEITGEEGHQRSSSLQAELDDAASVSSECSSGLPSEGSVSPTSSSSMMSLISAAGGGDVQAAEDVTGSRDESIEECIHESSSEPASADATTSGSSDARMFSPTTVRLARQVELGETMIGSRDEDSRDRTPDSIASALLTSEDDEDDLQAEYQPDVEFNSLQILYPPIADLSVAEKHRCLYGADPITP